ncbi:hypothetical protein GOP47_0014940 [Adiantum capillus-veneris]|uniref:Uncharacterized protein n=1 Tax=Adiantum capillus-veneris TaxID=13818 RepID=A0A9D4ZDZ5_ADICA|nr:hypothetical protein GOP47_0014940 [Adiantum capillus-veneris]
MDEHDENQLAEFQETQTEDSFGAIEDQRIDRMHDILIAVLTEVVGDETNNRHSLRSDLIAAVHSLKDAIDNYATNLADVQVVKLEEQIFTLRGVVTQLKSQLNKLNAIICRLSNLLTRATI